MSAVMMTGISVALQSAFCGVSSRGPKLIDMGPSDHVLRSMLLQWIIG